MHTLAGFRSTRRKGRPSRWATAGIALLSLMLGLAIMEILTALALPHWEMWAQRERELELLWRGCQYVWAIQEFHRWCNRYPWNEKELLDKANISGCDTSRSGFPPRFLRRAYPEPFQEEWQFICQDPNRPCPESPPANNPVKGVRSQDPGESILVFDGKTRHSDWQFVYEAGTPSTSVHPCRTIPLQ